MSRSIIAFILCGLLLTVPVGSARDSIEVSPFGNVFTDLLDAFHAEWVPCEGATTSIAAEVCFRSLAVSATYLAERLSDIVADYDAVGLRSGGWRAANGVWTVALSLPNSTYGHLEVYLAEAPDNVVKGVIRLVAPR